MLIALSVIISCTYASAQNLDKTLKILPPSTNKMAKTMDEEVDLEELFYFLEKKNCIMISLCGPRDHLVTQCILIYNEISFMPSLHYAHNYYSGKKRPYYIQVVDSATYNAITRDIEYYAAIVPNNARKPVMGTYQVVYNNIENNVERVTDFKLFPNWPEGIVFFEKQKKNVARYPELMRNFSECITESRRYADD